MQLQLAHASGIFVVCADCKTEPHHFVARGSSRRDDVMFSVNTERHQLECSCERRTGWRLVGNGRERHGRCRQGCDRDEERRPHRHPPCHRLRGNASFCANELYGACETTKPGHGAALKHKNPFNLPAAPYLCGGIRSRRRWSLCDTSCCRKSPTSLGRTSRSACPHGPPTWRLLVRPLHAGPAVTLLKYEVNHRNCRHKLVGRLTSPRNERNSGFSCVFSGRVRKAAHPDEECGRKGVQPSTFFDGLPLRRPVHMSICH